MFHKNDERGDKIAKCDVSHLEPLEKRELAKLTRIFSYLPLRVLWNSKVNLISAWFG